MLLTDPEAPALTTYPCVVFAAVAIATLAARMAPNSLWPAAGAVIYLFYYLVSFSADGGGQFQKDHEEVAALVALTAWALCMERRAAPRPFRIMAAATAIAAALVTPPIAILLGFFVGLLAAWSMVRRRWSDVWGYGVVVTAIAIAVLAVFVVSYLQTGLASDQALDLMLRFADPVRLDRWGVIPQIIAVAWIRDNYLQWEQPFGRATLQEIADFMRLRFLWPFLTGPLIAVVVLRMSGAFTGWRLTAPRDARSAAFVQTNRLASRCIGAAARGRCRGRRARAKSLLCPAQLVFCSRAGDAGNCRQRLGTELAAGAPRRRGLAARRASAIACRQPDRLAVPRALDVAIAPRNGECLAVLGRFVQLGAGVFPRQQSLSVRRDQPRGAGRRTAATVRNADLEHQCRFLLHGAGMPDRERHLLQNVEPARRNSRRRSGARQAALAASRARIIFCS